MRVGSCSWSTCVQHVSCRRGNILEMRRARGPLKQLTPHGAKSKPKTQEANGRTRSPPSRTPAPSTCPTWSAGRPAARDVCDSGTAAPHAFTQSSAHTGITRSARAPSRTSSPSRPRWHPRAPQRRGPALPPPR
eukprot:4121441-Prymnesium_polylepis.1